MLTTLFFIKHLSRAYPGAKEGANPDPLSTQDLCSSRASSAATRLQEAPEGLPAGRGTPALSPSLHSKMLGDFQKAEEFSHDFHTVL